MASSLYFCDDVPCGVWNCCVAPLVVPCYVTRQCMTCICRFTPFPCNLLAPCCTPPDLRPLYLGHKGDEAPKPLTMDRPVVPETTVNTRFFNVP